VTISVVITTCNRAELLRVSIERLRHQQYEPGDEVIVVDNASTDRTPEVVARAADGFPVRLQSLHERTPGKTPALNAGIAAASGDILALTDDDVCVAENWIDTIRGLFETTSIGLVGGRVDPRWEREPPRWLCVDEPDGYNMMASPLALLHYGEAQGLGVRSALGANMIVRRTVLEAVGGFDPHFGRRTGTLLSGEDHDFCERAAAAGYRCEYRPEVRVQHWVPAERTRLRYYMRWFFWSGVTQAMLDNAHSRGDLRATEPLVGHYLRRLLAGSASTLWPLLRGRVADAARPAMDAAFAAGYIAQQFKRRRVSEPGAIVGGPIGSDAKHS
jgi:glucosyl-dolichyl phosphate glucuronosyltransferase